VEAKVVDIMGFALEEGIMHLANDMQIFRGGCVDTYDFVGVTG
jgi:hypothetical protein